MYSPFLFVPLLPHRGAGDGEEEYIEDGAFDPDDVYQAGAAPGRHSYEDGVLSTGVRIKFMKFSFRPTGHFVMKFKF